MSASDDLPPDLEEPVLRTKARVASASLPSSSTQANSTAVPPPPPSTVVAPALSSSSDEPESLASQMLSASSASLAARAAKSVEDEKAAAKAALSGNFLSGNAIRKGFLLGGSSSSKKSASGDTSTTTASNSTTASIIATTRGNLDLIIEPKGSSKDKNASPSSGGGGGRNASLQLPEVQSAMASPSFAAKMSDGAWVTPALMQRLASDPKLVAGMQNARFMEAFNSMQKDPKGAMERARSDPPLADFLQRIMAALGAHFTELGEKEDKEKAAKSSSSSTTATPTSTTATEAKTKAVSSAGGENKSKTAASSEKEGVADIGLAPKESRRLSPSESLHSKANPLEGLGASTKAITTAAALGELPPGTPDDVRAVLSNPALVEALNDPQIRSILEECRSDPYALRKYLGVVSIRRKLDVLSKAGLIQLS